MEWNSYSKRSNQFFIFSRLYSVQSVHNSFMRRHTYRIQPTRPTVTRIVNSQQFKIFALATVPMH